MPVRNIIYDALQYGKQVADIAAKHRASDGDSKGHSRGEYLSGFYKEDIPLPDLPGQLENVQQSGNEIAERGMPT